VAYNAVAGNTGLYLHSFSCMLLMLSAKSAKFSENSNI